MYNISILVKANTSQNDIATIFNVKPGRAYYMMKASKSSSIQQIKRNLNLLNELDLDVKSGKKNEDLGLELYLLN
jgi:DNA polymerase-3 subunit delta